MNTIDYILNTRSIKSNNKVTSKELFSNIKLDVHHLKVFGCKIYVHDHQEKKTKLEPIAFEWIFVGYDDEHLKCTNVTILRRGKWLLLEM
jgi:hypothetical protein